MTPTTTPPTPQSRSTVAHNPMCPPSTQGANAGRPNAVHLAIARRLVTTGRARTIRLNANLSPADLAAHIGCSANTISRWENGTGRPTMRHATAYVTLLRDLAALERGPRDVPATPLAVTTGGLA